MEARRLLAVENYSVSTAALSVGYESATQFSREFARLFGMPPQKHRLIHDAADYGNAPDVDGKSKASAVPNAANHVRDEVKNGGAKLDVFAQIQK
jgi:AraC-like DNA-binding protein